MRCPGLQAELIKQGSQIPPGLGVALPPSTPPGALGVTLERSKQLCLQMYEKELLTDSSIQAMTAGTPQQQAAFAGETLFPRAGGGLGGGGGAAHRAPRSNYHSR